MGGRAAAAAAAAAVAAVLCGEGACSSGQVQASPSGMAAIAGARCRRVGAAMEAAGCGTCVCGRGGWRALVAAACRTCLLSDRPCHRHGIASTQVSVLAMTSSPEGSRETLQYKLQVGAAACGAPLHSFSCCRCCRVRHRAAALSVCLLPPAQVGWPLMAFTRCAVLACCCRCWRACALHAASR